MFEVVWIQYVAFVILNLLLLYKTFNQYGHAIPLHAAYDIASHPSN